MRDENKIRRHLLEPEGRAYLAARGIPVPPYRVVTEVEEAVRAAEELGYPVVMKVVSPQIIHKSEVGGVKTNLKTPEEVRQAFTQLSSIKLSSTPIRIDGYLVTRQVDNALEVIIGSIVDRQFGPVVMFGLGGIFVEVFNDVAFGIAPLERSEAQNMVKSIKGYPLLKGIRGQKAKDEEALVELLLKISELVWQEKEILELDLNPVFVTEKGVQIGDVRLLLSTA